MNTLRIFNIYQADFLIKNGCKVIAVGLDGKAYVEFLRDKVFDTQMEVWKHREH